MHLQSGDCKFCLWMRGESVRWGDAGVWEPVQHHQGPAVHHRVRHHLRGQVPDRVRQVRSGNRFRLGSMLWPSDQNLRRVPASLQRRRRCGGRPRGRPRGRGRRAHSALHTRAQRPPQVRRYCRYCR